MKKLLVIALAAIMVLSLSAVSMAAVTVGGEVVFGWNLIDKASAGNGNQSINDFAEAKVSATAELNEVVTAFAALKGVSSVVAADNFDVKVDEAWLKFTGGFGFVKVGSYGWNIKENLDLINLVGDLKTDAGINVVVNASEAVAVDLWAGQQYDKSLAGADGGFQFGAKVKYAADAFGVSLGYANFGNYQKDAAAPISLNAYYTMAPLTFYLNYVPEFKVAANTKVQSAIIGATYDSDSIYGRFEFDIQPTKDTEAGMGLRLGYKISEGAALEYQTITPTSSPKGTKATSAIKVKCTF